MPQSAEQQTGQFRDQTSMQVSLEKTGDLGRKMIVQLPADDIDNRIANRLHELRKTMRLKGFRPGKVPLNLVRQRYGEQIREEVVQQIMQSSLNDAIQDQKLHVAGISSIQPNKQPQSGQFEFTAELEVFPELPEIDVADLVIERPVVEISEADVEDMITTLREQRRKWTPASAPAAEGHRLRIAYVATADGVRVPAEGEREATPMLGAGVLFEDFERALIGLEAGAQSEVDLKFPDEFRDAQLAGKLARVSIRVKAVETSSLPEADDAFAESFGVTGGMQQMRVDVRRNLEREMRGARLSRIKQLVNEALASKYGQFQLPESSITREARILREQIQRQSGQPQSELPLERLRDPAERRVRLGLLMAEIARSRALEVDPARLQQKLEEIADTYEHPEQVIEMYRSDENLLEQIRNLVLEEQVVDWVLAHAAVTDRPMSFKELMNPK